MAKAKALDATGHRKFGWLDKFSYAAGDFGCNMSFALKSYLTIFWTQFMGINQLAMAGLLLLVQIWDAINDPLIGAMVDADKHKYKRNKFLAYINVGAIGLTVAGGLLDRRALVHRQVRGADGLDRQELQPSEVLEPGRDPGPPGVGRDLVQRCAVDQDPSLGGVVEPGQELHQRRLARPVVADERDRRAGRQLQ